MEEWKIQLKEMFDARVYLGHRNRQKNPKMQFCVYRKKNNHHIIDLFKTYCYLNVICKYLLKECSKGKNVLFIGTKKHIKKYVEKAAKDCESWYINRRWLGGFFTNWRTMKKSIIKLRQLNFSEEKNTQMIHQQERLEKFLIGVKTMDHLPDIVIFIGQLKDINAVKECQKLNIPSITILDTNCDPNLTDLFIPANDDSLPSVIFILNKLAAAIKAGKEKKSLNLNKFAAAPRNQFAAAPRNQFAAAPRNQR